MSSFRLGLVAVTILSQLLPQLSNGELTNNCTQFTSKTQGPYWIEENIHEKNVRWNVSYGVPLNLTFRVVDGDLSALYNHCVPMAMARIDLWQSRYDGRYSDEKLEHTEGEKWLRGYLLTNATGYATFYTIYPGWYKSRTVHIHVRLRLYNPDNTISYEGTTQLFFDDAISQAIYENVYPYNDRGTKVRDTFNTNDSLFVSNNLINLVGSYTHGNGYSSIIEFTLPFGNPRGLEDVSGNSTGFKEVFASN